MAKTEVPSFVEENEVVSSKDEKIPRGHSDEVVSLTNSHHVFVSSLMEIPVCTVLTTSAYESRIMLWFCFRQPDRINCWKELVAENLSR